MIDTMHLIAIQMQSYEIAVGVTSKPRLTHVRWGFSLKLYQNCTN